MKELVLGGGCFWCIEAVFQEIEGVEEVIPGYAGGEVPDPSYREVCSGTTGHAEVAKVIYDPEKITEEKIIWIFWHAHDPTTLNRQGNDVGPQYRSIILYENEEQEKRIRESKQKAEEEGIWEDPIVTEIAPLKGFYEAEEYHHDYYESHPQQPYCSVVIAPKIKKVRKQFPELIK
jgi:peptide-methionine (S)-S-oxide reductase